MSERQPCRPLPRRGTAVRAYRAPGSPGRSGTCLLLGRSRALPVRNGSALWNTLSAGHALPCGNALAGAARTEAHPEPGYYKPRPAPARCLCPGRSAACRWLSPPNACLPPLTACLPCLPSCLPTWAACLLSCCFRPCLCHASLACSLTCVVCPSCSLLPLPACCASCLPAFPVWGLPLLPSVSPLVFASLSSCLSEM